jgi:hypothetical protein
VGVESVLPFALETRGVTCVIRPLPALTHKEHPQYKSPPSEKSQPWLPPRVMGLLTHMQFFINDAIHVQLTFSPCQVSRQQKQITERQILYNRGPIFRFLMQEGFSVLYPLVVSLSLFHVVRMKPLWGTELVFSGPVSRE